VLGYIEIDRFVKDFLPVRMPTLGAENSRNRHDFGVGDPFQPQATHCVGRATVSHAGQSGLLLPDQSRKDDFCHDGNDNKHKSVGNEVKPFGVLLRDHCYDSQRFGASIATRMRDTFRRMSFGTTAADTRMGSGSQVVLQEPNALRRRFRCFGTLRPMAAKVEHRPAHWRARRDSNSRPPDS
jgi:hypothetical protein